MAETHFNLRRPNLAPDADVESYIDHGTAALPAVEEAVMEEMPEKIRRLVVLLSNSTHRQFEQMAAAQETTMSDLCRTWIEDAFKKYFKLDISRKSSRVREFGPTPHRMPAFWLRQALRARVK